MDEDNERNVHVFWGTGNFGKSEVGDYLNALLPKSTKLSLLGVSAA